MVHLPPQLQLQHMLSAGLSPPAWSIRQVLQVGEYHGGGHAEVLLEVGWQACWDVGRGG
jgi:hypothetical protein